jgi:hypothetical protein
MLLILTLALGAVNLAWSALELNRLQPVINFFCLVVFLLVLVNQEKKTKSQQKDLTGDKASDDQYSDRLDYMLSSFPPVHRPDVFTPAIEKRFLALRKMSTWRTLTATAFCANPAI